MGEHAAKISRRKAHNVPTLHCLKSWSAHFKEKWEGTCQTINLKSGEMKKLEAQYSKAISMVDELSTMLKEIVCIETGIVPRDESNEMRHFCFSSSRICILVVNVFATLRLCRLYKAYLNTFAQIFVHTSSP